MTLHRIRTVRLSRTTTICASQSRVRSPEMKIALIFLIQGLTSALVGCASPQYFYPPVFWQQDNCPFKKLGKGRNNLNEYFIKVLPYTGMNVVCPGDVIMNTWRARPPYMLTMYENLWHVDKAGYDKCEVNEGGKLLLLCDNPSKPKKLQFSFHPIYSSEKPRFVPGKHYYFISTSNGIEIDLATRRKSGDDGHCVQNNMKLHIYVCNPKIEDCVWEPPQCEPPTEIRHRMLMINSKLPRPTLNSHPKTKKKITTPNPTKAVDKTTKEPPRVTAQKIKGKCKSENETSIQLVMNFVLGGVIIFLIAVIIILACALAKRTRQYKPQKAMIPPETKQARIYESVPVQLPPNMVPIGSSQADYLVYARPCTPDPLYHTVIRTPSHHDYEAPVFRFPDVPQRSRGGSMQRSRAGSTQVKSSIERDDVDSAAPV